MKRILSIVLALCFSLNIVVSSLAASVISSKVYAAENEAATEAESSSPEASESYSKESDGEHPIGLNCSYYNVSDLPDQPDIVAESATLIDAKTGAILYQKEADTKRYPASITKVMTALLTIENCKMDDIVTFSDSAVNGVEAGSSSAGIPVGAKLTVEETLYAMMLVSANEAGAALAEQVSGNVGDFATLMTNRAKELGCTNTNFCNPHGLPDENHVTTAHDMALILKEALKHEEFRKIAGTINYNISPRQGISEQIELWNHAKILRKSSDFFYKYAEGAKTGFTQAALNTLVSYAKKDDVELICVVLKDHGAENSYKDSIALYEWGFKQVKGMKPLAEYNLNEDLYACEGIDPEQITSLNPTFNKDYYILVKQSIDTANLSKAFELQEDKANGLLGYINIKYDGELIGKCPVTYDTTSDAAQSYINAGGDADSANDAEPAGSSKSAFLHSIKTILVFLGCILIIMLLIVVIIINYMKSVKKKRRQQNLAKKIHRDAQMGKGRPQQRSPQRPHEQRPHSSSASRSSRSGRTNSSAPASSPVKRSPAAGSTAKKKKPVRPTGSHPTVSSTPSQSEQQPRQRRRRSERNR